MFENVFFEERAGKLIPKKKMKISQIQHSVRMSQNIAYCRQVKHYPKNLDQFYSRTKHGIMTSYTDNRRMRLFTYFIILSQCIIINGFQQPARFTVQLSIYVQPQSDSHLLTSCIIISSKLYIFVY
jgi:hypothetical protein